MNKISILERNHVIVSGNLESSDVLVFVHGFGTDQSLWRLVESGFEETHKIVKFDHVGAGKSAPAAFVQHKYLNLNQYADDLIEIIQTLDLNRPVVIGHSAGGMIAALAAVKNNALFSKLVLIGASPRYLNDVGYNGGFSSDDVKSVYKSVIDNFQSWTESFSSLAVNVPEQPDVAKEFATSLSRINPKNALTSLCSILQSDYREEMKRVTTKTLIIYSREDYFVPFDVSLYLHKNIADSQLVGINARGHFPQLTSPCEVIGALKAFF
ncbi:MAG: hypothetical protein RLZZ352_954 [Pseudomonadota bacterium]|jgi:sigma-B regulation protein RsbQ